MSTSFTDVPIDGTTNKTSELEWQSFPTPAAPTVQESPVSPTSTPSSRATAPNVPAGMHPDDPDLGANNPLACLSPSLYVKLFDVDTKDVVSRLRMSIAPFQAYSFLQLIQRRVDLYGPFWLCATLVFLIGVSGNIAKWANFVPGGAVSIWKFDFTLLTMALFTIYGYVAGAALCCWFLMNYFAVNGFTLIQSLCVYGYALTPLVAAAVLCIIPSNVLAWIAVPVAGALSALFVFKNVYVVVTEQLPPKHAKFVCAFIVGVQFLFAILLKMYFLSV